MSHKPSEAGSDEESTLQKEVQDYLDLLLTPAAKFPEADAAPPADYRSGSEQARRPAPSGDERPPTAPVATARGARPPMRKPPPGAERGVQDVDIRGMDLRDRANRETARPFAEPARPVAFKMPAAEVAPESPVPEPPAPAPPAPVPPAPEPVSPPLRTPRPEPPPVEPPAVDDEPIGVRTSVWMENGRPAWGQDRFECLLFSVGGLTLAVPLVELGTIYPINTELTPIFGQVEWFMGLLPVKDYTVKTVNTALLVMPERYHEDMAAQFSYVITINDVDWGLAVDNVSSAITLDPGQVRWRSGRSKRPWLAGTVVDHMCALLDVSQLAAMFVRADRASHRH